MSVARDTTTGLAQYAHLGQPENLSERKARAWRRANSYYIAPGETIAPETLADPPDCFTPKEWEAYVTSLPNFAGWRMPDSPLIVHNETEPERLSRQARSARSVACEDCTLAYQLAARLRGRCHPPEYAVTPVSRLLESEFTEGPGDDAASGDGTQPTDVLPQARVPEREVR